MGSSRLEIAIREGASGLLSVEDLPERFRMTQSDLDDMQRDAEPILRSVPGNDLGPRGSYRRKRW